MDLAKDEDDHNKSVEKKLKEIAKLQARIDLLSLDNSREAQAERQKLLEELAEKQEDLEDEQNDYAKDKREDALDEEADAFAKQKDDEIRKLQETLDSEQELYQAALDRINSAWTNGWDDFYRQLIDWNHNWGSDLDSVITQVWASATAAMQQYGSAAAAVAGGGGNTLPGSSSGGDSFSTQRTLPRVVKVQADGHAPPGLSPGDYVVTTGGTYQITGVNPDGSYMTPIQVDDYVVGDPTVDTPEARYAKLDERVAYWRDLVARRGYYKGGVIDYTGLAAVHGGSAAEMVLNNIDVGKVYDLIHSTPSLVGMMFRNIIDNWKGKFRGPRGEIGFGEINSPITVNIVHNGSMDDDDARRYGDIVAETALERLNDCFNRRGVSNIGRAILKA